jgi:poly(3-hydroxybutyrate) depolymerase
MRTLSFGIAGAAVAFTLACSSGDDPGKGFNTGPMNTAGTLAAGGATGTSGSATTAPTSGSATGGMSAGGSGVVPSGGSTTTTGGDAPVAGSSPTAGSGAGGMSTMPAGPDAVLKSSGCGKPLPGNQVKTIAGSRTGYTEYHVKETGSTIGADQPSKAVDRQFFVRVPADYDPNKPYRVVYLYQGCSANANEGNTATYALFDEKSGGTEQAVYVAVSLPPNHPNNNCYDNRAGTISQEWEAFQEFHDKVESTYCVDNNRIFVAGYSSGGWVSNMFSCYFGGIPDPPRKFLPKYAVRARAATSGGLITDNMPACNGPVGALYLHDAGDTTNVIAGSQTGRDNTLKQNKCIGSQTKPWGTEAGICVQYTDCPKAYPVVFCTTNGQGHNDQSNRAIPWFKQFYDMMNAP